MGGHYVNFRAMVEALRERDALRIVGLGELAGAIVELLSDAQAAAAMGERGKRVFEDHAGATARSLAVIQGILEGTA
jgi:3-deoxy-D-manno-octulosonic-acid transferase